ncbi:FAD/NAD(P)-binding domain-containing protein [Mycena crocata]|nr:FAD/NAD(P)-binding domain-containing protein [Mycena crocata]
MAIDLSDESQRAGALKVTIVGAGIAGLSAAVALRRNGHRVQIFEAAERKTEIGAALSMQTNALRVLDHFGVSRANLKGVIWTGSVVFGSQGGEGVSGKWLVPYANDNPGLLVHRSDLHDELRRLASGGDGDGPPAELRLGNKVVSCDTEEGTITLDTGEVVPADIVLGADGINSAVRTDVSGSVHTAPPSGWACFRAVFKAPNFTETPELAWLSEGVSGVRSIIARDGGPFRMLLIYPFRNGTLINFVGFFTEPNATDVPAGTPTASREDVLNTFQDFDPKFLALLDLPLQGSILKWQLRALPILPTWVRGRAVLIGDAAHATMPFLGQGAGMAIEEAGSIGCLLPATTTRDDVPARLGAYEELRMPRGQFVQMESVAQVAQLTSGSTVTFYQSQEIQSLLLEYDAITVASEWYEERFGPASSK